MGAAPRRSAGDAWRASRPAPRSFRPVQHRPAAPSAAGVRRKERDPPRGGPGVGPAAAAAVRPRAVPIRGWPPGELPTR